MVKKKIKKVIIVCSVGIFICGLMMMFVPGMLSAQGKTVQPLIKECQQSAASYEVYVYAPIEEEGWSSFSFALQKLDEEDADIWESIDYVEDVEFSEESPHAFKVDRSGTYRVETVAVGRSAEKDSFSEDSAVIEIGTAIINIVSEGFELDENYPVQDVSFQ
jgi:hypothetical protein